MFKLLIAGITAISLTLATTTPLHAQGMDRDDVGKLLFGLAAIAVIGKAIEQNRERDRETVIATEAGRSIRRRNRAASTATTVGLT